jgi:uncharacterized protein YaiL (DUF2058 family)
MADSLQDQLRALGLANKQPEQRPEQPPDQPPDRRPDRPHERKHAGKAREAHAVQQLAGQPPGELSLDRAWALREQEEQRRAQEARNRKLEEDRRRREINERVRAIVEAQRLNRDDAVIARNFLFRGRIRKLYVTPEQQRALNADELGIVYLAGGYHLLASEHLDAVRAISAEHVVDRQDGGGNEAEFPVPDDLDW